MTCYHLFSEYGDATIWGDTLADAVKRNSGHIYPQMRVETVRGTKYVQDLSHPLVIDKINGMRDTSKFRRGSWPYESVVVTLTDQRIISIDARVVESLPHPPAVDHSAATL